MKTNSPLKIGIIARNLTRGGVTRYIDNLCKQFNKLSKEEVEFTLLTDDPNRFRDLHRIRIISLPKLSVLLLDYVITPRLLHKANLDAIVYPKGTIPCTHFAIPAKKILVIHDLAYFDRNLNEYKLLDTLNMRLNLPTSCKHADKIIADSEHTRRDIISRSLENKNKVTVIYPGIDLHQFKKSTDQRYVRNVLSKHRISKPFLFYCGSLSPRKNILRTMQAFDRIKDKIPHNIYISSGNTWNDKAVRDYASANLKNRVFFIGYIPDDELLVFYSEADLFIYPSLKEGFGLPILEAQACGCPVLTSKYTSCEEIAHKSAILVNPISTEDIAQKLLFVLTNRYFRNKLTKDGQNNVAVFSWPKTSKDLIETVRNAITKK